MNWKKAKTILILIFLLADIFLAVTIISSNNKAEQIPAEIISSSVNLLSKNGIMVNEGIIPKKNKPLLLIQADNVVTDYMSFSKKILGDDAVLSTDNTYSSASGTISFSGDSFSFIKNPAGAEKKHLSERELKKIAEAFLKNCGFNFNNPKIVISENGNRQAVKYLDYLGKIPVFPSTVIVEFEAGEISKISGSWFNAENAITAQKIELKAAPGILIDFMSKYDGEHPCSITSYELGYNIFESDKYHKSATLIPTAKISASGGKVYYIDSRNSD